MSSSDSKLDSLKRFFALGMVKGPIASKLDVAVDGLILTKFRLIQLIFKSLNTHEYAYNKTNEMH